MSRFLPPRFPCKVLYNVYLYIDDATDDRPLTIAAHRATILARSKVWRCRWARGSSEQCCTSVRPNWRRNGVIKLRTLHWGQFLLRT